MLTEFGNFFFLTLNDILNDEIISLLMSNILVKRNLILSLE